ncbi:tetratricopeptide repeat protein [Candidatus Poribacteria bacterium]|nr:tetratricopeptide repeat protein [Candidatus Poribacteria bacterium]
MPTTLDLHIRPGKENGFQLEVFERGNSQPLANLVFGYDLSYMTEFEISRLDTVRKDPYERLERLTAFGGKLYKTLFAPEIEKIWKDYKEKSDFLTLCIRIAREADGLEILPWETLYDGEEFLAAGAKTSLTRLPLDIHPQEELPELPLPLKMLALMSSPLDLNEHERLAIEQEQEILLRATNSTAGQGRLHVEFEDEAKLPIIENSLESGYQIFHYSGHGIDPKSGGGLLLEDAQGKKRPTSVADFLQTLQKGEKEFRLAVFSGCQTARTLNVAGFHDLARRLARRKVPAVIAMQFSITDNAGLLFAEAFYPRLVEGQALDMAMSASRRVLLHSDEPYIQADTFAPVLILSNDRPLKTKVAEAPPTATQVGIDFKVYLPLPKPSCFYGRRKEYRAIRDSLLYKNHRAVIVHGIGGIGKTALISHVATRLKEHFKGVYAFDCRAGTLAPDIILLELHRFLERQGNQVLLRLMHQSFPPEQLAVFMSQVLSQIPLLVIFDNFEAQLSHHNGVHEITDENLRVFLRTLMQTTAQGSRFVFTSRYLFEVDERRVGTIRHIPLEDLNRPEALGLLQNLPHLASAPFDDKLRAYATFGGHPYALVTLDRHCSRKTLADALEDAKTVQAELREFLAIEMTYSNLSERSGTLLNRLAAFRKPVGLDATHWVMGERIELPTDFLQQLDREKMPEEMQSMSDDELLRFFQGYLPEQRRAEGLDKLVEELIGWGLLTPIEEDGEASLLSIHSLVRQFCRDKLDRTLWNGYLQDAAGYYTNQSKILSRDQKSVKIVLDEIEASELLMESDEFEKAASIIVEVAELLNRWGLGRFGESLHRRILPKVKKETQSVLIHNLGNFLQARGDYESALKQYEKSLKIKEELGNRAGVARSLHQIGMIHQDRGDYQEALKQYEKSLKIAEELGDRAGVARSLHQIGMIHEARGDYQEALKQYEISLKIAEELGDRAGVARSLHQIGMIHEARGDYQEALKQYEISLKIAEELGDRGVVALSLNQIGQVYYLRGDYESALQQYEISLKIAEELGDRAGVATSLHQIGMIHQDRGDYQEALKQYEISLKIAEELGNRANVARSLHQIGMIHQDRGDYQEALKQYEISLKIKEELGDRAGVASSRGQIGLLFRETNRFPEAFENLFTALRIFLEIGSPDAGIAINNLRTLRAKWGVESFDSAWREKTGGDVPDWLKE